MNQLVPLAPALPALADDIEQARDFAEQATAASTSQAYESDLRLFVAWARLRGIEPPLPATPAAICAFLGSQAATGTKRASSIARSVAALAFWHRMNGIADPPTQSAAVRATVRGIRRSLGTAPDRKAPVTADRLGQMLACIPTDTMRGRRDRALLLLGFAAALRRSELIALDVADLTETDEGLRVLIRRSKTDQEGTGQEIAVPRGYRLRPVAAVRSWLDAAEITAGFVFRQVNKADRVQSEPLHSRAVAEIVKRHAARAGYDPTEFSGHSLRAGFVTSAAAAGATIFKMQAVTRHKSLDVLSGYVRDADLFKDHAGETFL